MEASRLLAEAIANDLRAKGLATFETTNLLLSDFPTASACLKALPTDINLASFDPVVVSWFLRFAPNNLTRTPSTTTTPQSTLLTDFSLSHPEPIPRKDMSQSIEIDSYPSPTSVAPADESSNAEYHLRKIASQVLSPALAHWGPIVTNLALTANSHLLASSRIPSRDAAFDLRTSLKIKKVPGGSPNDSEFVDGIVFSKRVAHKSMVEPKLHPRVLLLALPLEFQQHPNQHQFMSLETVISQERDYVNNLLGKIIALRPDVVFVGGNVSRIALDLLVRARISLASNVKGEILGYIARCSGAKVIHGVEQIVESSIGTFQKYSIKVFDDPLIEGIRKVFVCLEGCRGDHIGTVIVRGDSKEALRYIKEIIGMLVNVAYNVFIEHRFLQDELAVLPKLDTLFPDNSQSITESDKLEYAIWKYKTSHLSASPYVSFPPPHVLIRLRNLKTLQSEASASAINSPQFINEQLLSSLESNSAIYFDNLESLSAFNHQKIVFLFSSICRESMTPCNPAELHVIEYYSEHDVSLGTYIEDICSNCQTICPSKGCGLPMLQHFRSYAHGEGRIRVDVENLDISAPPAGGGIQMWSFCKQCQMKSPVVKLSADSRKYSFGKYLELMFYMRRTLNAEMPLCDHDIHREHIRFFSYNQWVVRFEFEELVLLEVSVPPMKAHLNAEDSLRLKSQDYETRRSQIVKFYDSVVSRIKHFSTEVLPYDKVLLFKEFSNGLSKRAGSERKTMLQILQQSFTQSSDMDSLALNTVLHNFYENVGKWENDFSVLARSFFTVDLTKETPARRIGSIHLREIFSNHTTIQPVLPPDLKETVIHIPLGTSPVENGSMETTFGTLPPRSIDTTLDEFNFSAIVSDDKADEEVLPTFVPTSDSFLGYELDEPIPTASSGPIFSMAARWRLELIEDEEEEGGTGEGMGNNIVSMSSSNNELDEPTELQPMVFANPVPIPSNERASILKTIAALWSGSFATLPPLEYPLSASEHLFHDSLVIVREDEPSSLIAFTLSSSKYINKLKQWQMNSSNDSIIETVVDEGAPSEAAMQSNAVGDIEEKLTSGKGHHVKFEFWDGSTKLDCKVFYAEQFDALRRNCGFEDGFVHSLSRCVKWEATGGKSGSAFLKTRDDRLILKQLSRQEMEALLKFAPYYFTYISEAFFHKLPTVLAKLFGFYRIGYKNPTTNKSLKMDVLVMENLFWGRSISKIFDLKGSMRNRHVQSTGKQNQVLLDENLLEYLCKTPLYIREYSKRILRASVWNDTLFLSKMDVMDYSLLVGIDEEKQELVVGIVDYMRTFTWDKKLESWVKETGILGGGTTQPTILSPRQYKNRFRESMDRYFLTVTSFLEKIE